MHKLEEVSTLSFEKIDTNGDEVISREEYNAFFADTVTPDLQVFIAEVLEDQKSLQLNDVQALDTVKETIHYNSAYEISAFDIDENERLLADVAEGKKLVMVMNVASY